MSAGEVPKRQERPGKAAIMRAAVEVMGEDGYEGASIRDMAARAGVSVAALYYHFPSKLDLLRQFLEEAYDVTLARLDRRLRAADPAPPAQLDEIVGTLIASHLHDEWAQLASNVAFREHTRLLPADRRVIDKKRRRLLRLVEDVIARGVASGDFTVDEPREAARAIIILTTSLVEPYREMRRSMHGVIALYQGFARAIACTPAADDPTALASAARSRS
ncbi:MAG TPA: TetR/AcrR family transcriptional regulator [Acidimicrobiales bacterium]|nr:TetR/AcrR family transcriptional regulator [Acidimicrobiales bacterium]